MKKVGIFGSEYQADKQLVIKRLFEKLASLEAEVFVDLSLIHISEPTRP